MEPGQLISKLIGTVLSLMWWTRNSSSPLILFPVLLHINTLLWSVLVTMLTGLPFPKPRGHALDSGVKICHPDIGEHIRAIFNERVRLPVWMSIRFLRLLIMGRQLWPIWLVLDLHTCNVVGFYLKLADLQDDAVRLTIVLCSVVEDNIWRIVQRPFEWLGAFQMLKRSKIYKWTLTGNIKQVTMTRVQF